MSYIIYTSSGTVLTTVATGKLNTSTTSLTLVGRNANNYGQYFNQNFVDLLTSFASPTYRPPKNAVKGQLWYDTTFNVLKIFNDDTGFIPVNSPTISSSQPVGQVPGEFWYNPADASLNFMDDTGQYISVTSFPRYDVSGWHRSLTYITDVNSNTQHVTLLKSYGEVIGAITTTSFTATTAVSTGTFSRANTSSVTLAAGLTIIGDIYATGSINSTNGVSIQVASNAVLGGVKIGNGIGIAGDGTISVTTASFALQTATNLLLGGVKIGNGLSVSADGTVSVTTGSFALQTATNTVLGGVKIGTGIDITNDGTINVTTASTSTLVANAVHAQTATTATSAAYAYAFNTATLVATAVNLVGGVSINTSTLLVAASVYAQTFNTATLVANAVNATNAVNAQTVTGGVGVYTLTAGTGTSISANSGTVTIWSSGGSGLQSRRTVQSVTSSLSSGTSANTTVTMAKGYALYSIQASAGAWVTLYSSLVAQISDGSRSITTDPTPGSGVIAESITTASGTTYFTPAVYGYNADTSVNTNAYLKIYNNTAVSTPITVTLTYLQLEG